MDGDSCQSLPDVGGSFCEPIILYPILDALINDCFSGDFLDKQLVLFSCLNIEVYYLSFFLNRKSCGMLHRHAGAPSGCPQSSHVHRPSSIWRIRPPERVEVKSLRKQWRLVNKNAQ